MLGAAISIGLVVFWSSGFVGAELGTREASADTLLMWRFLVATALLGGGWLLSRRPWLPRRAVGEQILIGLLAQGVYVGSVVWAVGLGVPLGTAALIAALQPLAAATLAGRLLGDPATGRQWAGLGAGLAGVVLVVQNDVAITAETPGWAYVLPFTGMAGLLSASFLERRARVPVSPVDALPVHCATSAVSFTLVATVAGRATPPPGGEFWVAIAWVVVLSTAGAYGCYLLSLRRFGVTHTSALIYLTPPTTALWAYVMFGDALSMPVVLGMAVCLSGVLTATVPSRQAVFLRRRMASARGFGRRT